LTRRRPQVLPARLALQRAEFSIGTGAALPPPPLNRRPTCPHRFPRRSSINRAVPRRVRRDIERLSESDSAFGVAPRYIGAATIERQLKDSGFVFEILAVDIKSSTLKEIAAKLKPLAEKLDQAAL